VVTPHGIHEIAVTSYRYVAVAWLNHRAAFRRIRAMDRGPHWANFAVLFMTAFLPFATAVLARAMQEGDPTDARTAIGLYALIGALLCTSWWLSFRYLSHHPELVGEDVGVEFFAQERTLAAIGVALYVAAGMVGSFVTPLGPLANFLAIPAF
jgi:uncharacterized membrane protein